MSNLFYTSIDGIVIDLAIEDRVTLIGGDSATGKTFIINTFKNAIENKGVVKECSVDISRFVIIDNTFSIENINLVREKSIVFIDKYDIFSKEQKKRIWDKMRNVSAAWIIMTRNADIPTRSIKGSYGRKELRINSVNANEVIITFK